ncbi:hypothetical protein BKA70DRAFT_1430098 [Coprinopsis sp. MPI-PUGE-AT-0042]|nr:hypothetical protein BKA70DRAFT_1430098 [Coprinopsis sp. MPI-PUGE-AT-0042]
MSPNPAFLEQTERRKKRKQEGVLGTPSKTLSPDSAKAVDDDPWDVWGNGSDAPSPSLDSPVGSPMETKTVEGPGAGSSAPGKGIVGGIGQGLLKSQKRASLMFSDMGQSIASALTDPGTPSTRPLKHSPLSPSPVSAPGKGKAHNLTLSRALSADMLSSANRPSTPATLRSLLDDDDDDEVFGRMISAEPVLKPD